MWRVRKSIADLIFSTKLLALPLKESQGKKKKKKLKDPQGMLQEILKQLKVDKKVC